MARALAGSFLIIQLIAGFLLFFSAGLKSNFGWALVYGPNLRSPQGTIATYAEGLACLVPVAWLSSIEVATRIRAAGRRELPSTLSLSSFIVAGLIASALYAASATLRIAKAGQHPALEALAFSVAAHLALFAAFFIGLQWIRIVACLFNNPGLVQFGGRCAVAMAALAVLTRKIVFALLGFNGFLANMYAAGFAITTVMFVAGLILAVREYSCASGVNIPLSLRTASWRSRLCAIAATAGAFYLVAIKFVAIDWEHIVSSVTAFMIWGMLVWVCLMTRTPVRSYGTKLLLPLTIIVLAGCSSINISATRGSLFGALEQYANYDPSFFALRQMLRPVVHDEQQAAWYQFLSQHANIRANVQSPQFPLTADLKPTQAPKPHIFLFVIDGLRRDYISPYNPKVTFTPAIQKFAQESVIFQNAFSPYAGTPLADGAIFSGFQQINRIFAQPVSRLNNLQPLLRTAGYHSYMSYNVHVAVLARETVDVTRLQEGRTDLLEFKSILDELETDIRNRKHPERPIFAFAQPVNVHNLWLAWHGGNVDVKPHPGFDDKYASGVERVDQLFGNFVEFLKKEGLYQNSIVVLTADHGESLGEMGRESHVSSLTPEIIRIPMIVHLPDSQKAKLVWDADQYVSVHDITPTLHYLLGYRKLNQSEMSGHPLFTLTREEQLRPPQDHYLLMSSYMPVFGILSGDRKSLFFTDATLGRNYFYNLAADPTALQNKITPPVQEHYESLIRQDLQKLDKFYNVDERSLSQ